MRRPGSGPVCLPAGAMGFSLLPRVRAAALPDLTPARLQRMGIRAVLLDFDNTVVPYTTDIPTPAVRQWFADMQAAGLPVCVVSNSRKDRVQNFCDAMGLPCVRRAGKPSPRGVREAMDLLQVRPQETALVGDQIYTDTLAANLAGAVSILVEPLALSNLFLKLRHIAEQPWILAAGRRKLS